MSESTFTPWREQFGLDSRRSPEFFTGKEELSATIPQAHLLQRGFDDLSLDGILCTENTPLVYFRQVDQIDNDWVANFRRTFWYHGGAPVLMLISDNEVHIYSGLTLPSLDDANSGLVTTLDRVGDDLAAILLSVESGDFFHANREYFNPEHRVDRALLANLRDTRDQLNNLSQRDTPEEVLDGLLCRLVFTAYLFDRGVIGTQYLRSAGIDEGEHLRDVLGISPTGQAKVALYKLFARLAEDFNGDLFADNLNSESKWIVNKHLDVLSAFFHGTSVKTGQKSFWPYDFGQIPVETISAIYERFLKDSHKNQGAFYTPRFLAEIVLDVALDKMEDLVGKTFLDPACGSGIFLVGLFNRLAQHWKAANPRARNNTIARELMALIQKSLFGVDVNPTACRIAAFSLYLAYLDHLTPRDIQELQAKGRALPRLVSDDSNQRNITCADFFEASDRIPTSVSLVIGNPPWGSIAGSESIAGKWCIENGVELPDKQIASAFISKASQHVKPEGQVCLVIPAGVLFNFSEKAVNFQKNWLSDHNLECVLNLSDFRMFLFEVATHPAVVVRYSTNLNPNKPSFVEYWSPKSDWPVAKAEIIRVGTEDRVKLLISDIRKNLVSEDAPQIWKRNFWATRRDRRLLDRLSDLPRLGDVVRTGRSNDSSKPWVMSVGFQPVGKSDDPNKASVLKLPSRYFVPATNRNLSPVLLKQECDLLDKPEMLVRSGSNKTTVAYKSPLVMVAKGFNLIGFSGFDVSFQDALRGISGPPEDRAWLQFLAAYLRSPLARYFVFHTSSNWGISRPQIHVIDLVRVPFIHHSAISGDDEKHEIVNAVATLTDKVETDLAAELLHRASFVDEFEQATNDLVYRFFGVTEFERDLVTDTVNLSVRSSHPARSRLDVPTVKRSTPGQRDDFVKRVCDMLNRWSKRGSQGVRGTVIASEESGVGVAIFEKVDRTSISDPMTPEDAGVVETLHRLRELASKKRVALELIRGVKMFDRNRLYIVKPLDQRNWTLTAAMNDADEIAGSLLMKSSEQPA